MDFGDFIVSGFLLYGLFCVMAGIASGIPSWRIGARTISWGKAGSPADGIADRGLAVGS